MVDDDALIHEVERAEMRQRVRSVERVVIPRPRRDDSPCQPARHSTERRNSFGKIVDHRLDAGMLWIEHLVDADEVRSDHIPMNVLQVTRDGRVECEICGAVSSPSDVEMHSRRRFEGASDPDDLVAILGVSCPVCATLGTLIAHVGPMASGEDAHVTCGVQDRRRDEFGPPDAAPGEMVDGTVAD